MAFTAKWISAAGSIVFDGNPYSLDDGMGLGAADVRNLWERGPQQDGVSDLGYRYEPRTVTLGIRVGGTSQAHLDALRGSLQYHFSPRQGLGTLQITRDDGEVRELYARRTGPMDIPLVQADRAGKLHKTAVQLFAPNPAWTEPTAQAGTLLGASDWWLAFNTIGSASVLEHVESPTQGQQWTYTGTVTAGSPWMIAFRTGRESPAGGSLVMAFEHDPDELTSGDEIQFQASESGGDVTYYALFPRPLSGTSLMTAGTHNYFMIERGTGGNRELYRDGALIASTNQGSPAEISAPGTVRRWRSDSQNTAANRWTNALPRAAIYDISPTPGQVGALHQAMESGGSVFSLSLAYEGDLPEYPVIVINGPISDPILTNTTTGETLDFTGYTIGSADFYTIDLRYGSKTVRNSGGDNRIGQLSNDSDLATFHVEPAPVAAGGTNVFSLSGTATGTATAAVITYYNRYESW